MRIEEAAARTQARIDLGLQPVIGMNKYRLAKEDALKVMSVDNTAVRNSQIASLKRLREDRDQAQVDGARKYRVLTGDTNCKLFMSIERSKCPGRARSFGP